MLTLEQVKSGVTLPEDAIVETSTFNGIGYRFRYNATVRLVHVENKVGKKVWLYLTSIWYGLDWEKPGLLPKRKGGGNPVTWLLLEARHESFFSPEYDSLEAIQSAGKVGLPSTGSAVDDLIQKHYIYY